MPVPQSVLDLVSRFESQHAAYLSGRIALNNYRDYPAKWEEITARLPDEQKRLQRRISATDRAIDTLVFQLYDLTPEEIAIVEAHDLI